MVLHADKKIGIFKFWMPVFLYAGFIFYMSSLPVIGPPIKIPFVDKIIHIAEYALFGWLLARAISFSLQHLSKVKLYYSVIVISFLYGISDEFHQSFIATRTSSIWDVLADTVGGFLGVFLFL